MPRTGKGQKLRRTSGAMLCSVLLGVCLALSLVSLFFLWLRLQPTFSDVSYRIGNGTEVYSDMQLIFPSTDIDQNITVHFTMDLSPGLLPQRFRFIPDDCLLSLTVNGVSLPQEKINTCDYVYGKVIDLSPYLHSGPNDVVAVLDDGGGMAGLTVRVDRTDPILLFYVALGFLLTVVLILQILRLLQRKSLQQQLYVFILIFGAWLRVWYALATHYSLRGHDVDGHIEYVRYILQHWQIPNAAEGWQFYQPPLYYFFSALFVKGFGFLGMIPDTGLMQAFSAFLSIVSLGLFAFILRQLWNEKRDLWTQNLALLAFCVLPSLVYFSGRINNDVFAFPMSLFALALLFYSFRVRSAWPWYCALTTLAAAILSKTNSLLISPVFVAALFLHPQWTTREKIRKAALGCLLFFALTSWFFIPRTFGLQNEKAIIVGNIDNLSDGLALQNTFSHLLTFNATEILRHPFNNAWSDETRRQYFWEYFFRSVFFGEFEFSPSLYYIAQSLLFLWLILLPWIIVGFFRTFAKRYPHDALLVVLLVSLLVGHFAFRIGFPFSSSQDFRYSVVLVLPGLWWLLSGKAILSKYASIAFTTIYLLACMSALFFLVGVLIL